MQSEEIRPMQRKHPVKKEEEGGYTPRRETTFGQPDLRFLASRTVRK